MESEIAELESFIDSYVGEDENSHIQSETFTNSSEKNGYDFYDKDFEEELKEHQSHQDSILSDMALQHSRDNLLGATNISPDALTGASVGHVGPTDWYSQSLLLYPNMNPSVSSEVHYPSNSNPYYMGPDISSLQDVGYATSIEPHKNITNNDLRHRLNSRNKESTFNNSQRTESINTRRKKTHGSKVMYSRKQLENDNSDQYSVDSKRDQGKFRKGAMSPQSTSHNNQHSRQSSHSSESGSTTSPKVSIVSGRSKSEVRSWLHQDPKSNKQSIERQLRNMKLSKKSDLSKVLKSAQTYIVSEEKMKEVANMICSKAMKNPVSAESGAVLSNEMSHCMVNGTSFRSVLLNVVQNHFKNRNQLISRSIENDSDNDWCGFVSFITQLYLNLRTSSNERLKALVNPVYDCFVLILEQKSLSFKLSKCLFDNLKLVGSSLDEANPQRMSQLMALLRDNCVLSGRFSVEARRNLLQSLEYYARGWKSHTLDVTYYNKFSDK